MNWVEAFEQRYRTRLDEYAQEIKRDFAGVSATVYSKPGGTATPIPGHDLGISCVLSKVAATDPDVLDLMITIQDLKTAPEIAALDVTWGHPSGHMELDLQPAPTPLTQNSFERIDAALPQLYAALRQALTKGKP
jgi:hypothetical protein